jgi:tetratricopeptide (TPR) repeat protein
MQVKFRILGGLEAEVDGVPVPLAGQRDRTVLATLLLEAGHVVPVSSLVAALWADDPPVTATKQVRNAVSRLRGLLAGADRPGVIVAEGDGYRLAVRPDCIDARVFEAQVTRAAEAAAAGRRRDAARILADALGLWRGPFLAGVPGRPAEAAAAAWAERRLAAEEAYHEHMLALSQRSGDVRGQAQAHRGISRALAQLGSYQEARVHAEQAASLSRQAGDLIGQARAELDAGEACERERRYADALRHAERALALFRAAGLRPGVANALNCVGWCHTQLGDYQQAIACCEQSLNLHRQGGDSYGEAGTWDSIGCAQQQLGQHDAAVDCFVQALSLLRELGDRGNEAEVLSHLGDSQQALGDHPAAQASWLAALRIREELRHPGVAELRAKLARSGPGLA